MRNVIIAMMVMALMSCSGTEGPRKPSASGKSGEMLVIINKGKWEGLAGEIVQKTFMSYVPMLPQAEPSFNLIQIDESNFTKLFETHRNLFFAEFDPSLERGKIEVSRDVWSYPQMVIRVKAPNEEVFQRIMENNQEAFIDYFLKTERERLINAYSRMVNQQARNLVREKFNLDITVPEGYFVAKDADNFLWLRQSGSREDLELGLMISVQPYIHPDKDFNQQTIWARRDSMTKLQIPGNMPNSYMTSNQEIRPLFREINFNEKYAVEARGLWRVEGDFMAGPFINITFVNEKTNQLINLDGFVYAPKYDKRDYLRQVEALMYSVKPLEEEKKTEEPA